MNLRSDRTRYLELLKPNKTIGKHMKGQISNGDFLQSYVQSPHHTVTFKMDDYGGYLATVRCGKTVNHWIQFDDKSWSNTHCQTVG